MGLFKAGRRENAKPMHYAAQYPIPLSISSKVRRHYFDPSPVPPIDPSRVKTLHAIRSSNITQLSEDVEFYSMSDQTGDNEHINELDRISSSCQTRSPPIGLKLQRELDTPLSREHDAAEMGPTPMVRDDQVPLLVDKKASLLESTVRILQGHFDRLQGEYHAVLKQQNINEKTLEDMVDRVSQSSSRIDNHEERLHILEQSRSELARELVKLKSTVADCQSEMSRLDRTQRGSVDQLSRLAQSINNVKWETEFATPKSHRVIDLFRRQRPVDGLSSSRKES